MEHRLPCMAIDPDKKDVMPEASVNAMLTFQEAPALSNIIDAFGALIWSR